MARTPYIRHTRHRSYDRTRKTSNLKVWLLQQSARIGQTPDYILEVMMGVMGLSAPQVEVLAVVAPENTVLPAITGTAQVGQELSCSIGTWTGGPVLSYTFQWKAAGAAITDATAATYAPVGGDVGKTLTCDVTADNGIDTPVVASAAATAAVIAA